MIQEQTNISFVNNFIIFCVLAGPFGFGIISYLSGNTTMAYTSMCIFVVLFLVYYFFIKGFLEEENKSRYKSIFLLHLLVVIQFLVGPFVWAGLNFWAGNLLTASITTAIFLVFLAIYMIYGRKYFQALKQKDDLSGTLSDNPV